MNKLLKDVAYCCYCNAVTLSFFVWVWERVPTGMDVLVSTVMCVICLLVLYWRRNEP